MSLQNLEQVRAKSALAFAERVRQGKTTATGKDGGEAMKKIPPMIMGSGLLAAIAFAVEERRGETVRKGHLAIFDAIAMHLSSPEIDIARDVAGGRALIDYLSQQDSHTLKLATDEALAWLGYARRFLSSGDGDES